MSTPKHSPRRPCPTVGAPTHPGSVIVVGPPFHRSSFIVHPCRKTGFSLIETLVAMMLVLTAIALSVELLTGGMGAWKRAQERATAARLAANAVETWQARPWQDWRPGKYAIPASDLEELPQAAGGVRIEPDPAFSGLKRMTVHLRWQPAVGPAREMEVWALRGK